MTHVVAIRLCIACLGLTACSGRDVQASASTQASSTSDASTSDGGHADGSAAPDLGSDAAVCGTPEETLGTDEDLAQLAGCEFFEGSLLLRYPNVTELSPLASMRRVGGTITLGGYNQHLQTLAGLDRLEWVGTMHFNGDGLTDLSALSKLVGIEDYLAFHSMPELTTMHGFENVRTIGGTLELGGNAVLTSLDGLGALESIGADFVLTGNPKVTSLDGLASLREIRGDVQIIDNLGLGSAEIAAFLDRVHVAGTIDLE